MILPFPRLRAVSLFSWSVKQNVRDTEMTTSRGFATRRSRSRTLPALNLKKKTDCSQSTLFPYFFLGWPPRKPFFRMLPSPLIPPGYSLYWAGFHCIIKKRTLSCGKSRTGKKVQDSPHLARSR